MKKLSKGAYEDTKGFLRVAETLLEILILTVLYYIIWRDGYRLSAFAYKGKYVLMGVYAVLLYAFFQNSDCTMFGQLRQRHQQGLEVALSVLSDLSGEEMSHVTAVFHRQTGPVNEQALKDCIRIIKSEYSAANVSSADDLMAFRNKLRESKGVQG